MNQIIITKGSGGYGGPLVIKPTDKKNKVMYITGGNEPAILKRIVELTGLIPVNGFKTKVPDEELALIQISEPTRLRRISDAVICLKK